MTASRPVVACVIGTRPEAIKMAPGRVDAPAVGSFMPRNCDRSTSRTAFTHP